MPHRSSAASRRDHQRRRPSGSTILPSMSSAAGRRLMDSFRSFQRLNDPDDPTFKDYLEAALELGSAIFQVTQYQFIRLMARRLRITPPKRKPKTVLKRIRDVYSTLREINNGLCCLRTLNNQLYLLHDVCALYLRVRCIESLTSSIQPLWRFVSAQLSGWEVRPRSQKQAESFNRCRLWATAMEKRLIQERQIVRRLRINIANLPDDGDSDSDDSEEGDVDANDDSDSHSATVVSGNVASANTDGVDAGSNTATDLDNDNGSGVSNNSNGWNGGSDTASDLEIAATLADEETAKKERSKQATTLEGNKNPKKLRRDENVSHAMSTIAGGTTTMTAAAPRNGYHVSPDKVTSESRSVSGGSFVPDLNPSDATAKEDNASGLGDVDPPRDLVVHTRHGSAATAAGTLGNTISDEESTDMANSYGTGAPSDGFLPDLLGRLSVEIHRMSAGCLNWSTLAGHPPSRLEDYVLKRDASATEVVARLLHKVADFLDVLGDDEFTGPVISLRDRMWERSRSNDTEMTEQERYKTTDLLVVIKLWVCTEERFNSSVYREVVKDALLDVPNWLRSPTG